MAAKKKSAVPSPGLAGSHAGSGLTPEDYEAMMEDAGNATWEAILDVTPTRARELEAEIAAKTAQAEADIAAREVRVNFRWEAGPLEVVKQAAANIGVPYQTYIKQVIFQRALEDIARYRDVAGKQRPL